MTAGAVARASIAAVLAILATAPAGAPQSGKTPGGDVCETTGPPFAIDRRHDLGDGRWLCLQASPGVRLDESDGSVLELPESASLRIATAGRGDSRELRVVTDREEPRYEWSMDGRPAVFDAAARAWMADALQASAGLAEIESIRAQATDLEAQIAGLLEEERGVRDAIGSLLAERSRLLGRIGAVRDEERALRDAIATLRGEESALRVELGGHRAAVASLREQAEGRPPARRRELEEEIARHAAAIERLESRLSAASYDRRAGELEARIASLRTEQRIRAIEAEVDALDVDDRVAGLEKRSRESAAQERVVALRRRLTGLDADRRVASLRRELEPLLRRLLATP